MVNVSNLATTDPPGGLRRFPNSTVTMLPEEVLLKTWKVTQGGHLHLTDVRLVFTGHVSKTTVVQEMHVGDINGITGYIQRGVGLGVGVITGVLGIATAFAFLSATTNDANDGSQAGHFLLALVLGIAFIAFVRYAALNAARLAVSVHTRTSQGTPVTLGGTVGGFKRLGPIYAKPTSEAENMISEIGARIRDIQINGSTRQANPEGPWSTALTLDRLKKPET